MFGEPGAERFPAVGILAPLVLRDRRHDDRFEAEGVGSANDGGPVGVEVGETDVGGRTGQPEAIELPAEPGRVVAIGAAIRLDRIEADRRQRLEMRLDRGEIARAIELEGYPIVRHHTSDLFGIKNF